ncbi:secreted RxLR effector peptide protein, putative [Phytophthora infestans T30-4]|uniref:Secreted RxLR effector peptide protein, putative n=1 Tax=Phytophthora infestans (strain T30-4) TaxID=403677 RepID=D0NJM3_PHYIT|nr:secreted RxLR effector peptide protein, putative [Phytophthora infestans T30-4]EEY59959.1 secreted RxLR effector peptide protein, putative [Phytophthora infestans T30-4]|eukprot:XP_002900644.1 secreted RxLR effector peptide protein, putative [Phytophthora infestans T30-4]
MSLQCLILALGLLIFAARNNTCLGQSFPSLRVVPHVAAAAPTSSRSLRSTSPTNETSIGDQDKEERAQGKRISAVTENLAYKLGLKAQIKPEAFFTRIHFSETVGKLDDSTEFMRWLQYVLKYRNKMGETSFSDAKFAALLRNAKPDEEVLELLQSLRRVDGMKDLVDRLQTYLFKMYPSIHNMMNEAWLNTRQNPRELFNLVLPPNGFQDQYLIQWLRYTEMYKTAMGVDSFPIYQMNDLFLRHWSIPSLVELLQSIKKIPDLEKLAESMQAQVFQVLYARATPKDFQHFLYVTTGDEE